MVCPEPIGNGGAAVEGRLSGELMVLPQPACQGGQVFGTRLDDVEAQHQEQGKGGGRGGVIIVPAIMRDGPLVGDSAVDGQGFPKQEGWLVHGMWQAPIIGRRVGEGGRWIMGGGGMPRKSRLDAESPEAPMTEEAAKHRSRLRP